MFHVKYHVKTYDSKPDIIGLRPTMSSILASVAISALFVAIPLIGSAIAEKKDQLAVVPDLDETEDPFDSVPRD